MIWSWFVEETGLAAGKWLADSRRAAAHGLEGLGFGTPRADKRASKQPNSV